MPATWAARGSESRLVDQLISVDNPYQLSGSVRAVLAVGGIGIGLAGKRPLSEIDFGPAYSAFLSDGPPDIEIELVYVERVDPLPGSAEPVFDSECLWSLYRVEDLYSIVLSHLEAPNTPYRVATFDRDFTSGAIVSAIAGRTLTRPGLLPNPLEYPLGESLTICVLGTGLGLMVHALGVEINGSGCLLLGHSGQGKSTMAELLSGDARILSDDRVVVRYVDGAPWIFGTPWHGDFREVSPEGAPLEKIYFIDRGDSNRLESMGSALASASMFARSFPPVWSREGLSFTLELIETLVREVACQWLFFTPTRDVLELFK